MVGDININTPAKNQQTENYMNVLNLFECKLLIDLSTRFADDCKFPYDLQPQNFKNRITPSGSPFFRMHFALCI